MGIGYRVNRVTGLKPAQGDVFGGLSVLIESKSPSKTLALRAPAQYRRFCKASYETEETSDQVLNRAFEWRKGSDGDVGHTAMRLGYQDPLKGRVHYDTLTCADGTKLYRITVDDTPLLYSDEEDYGGWMTY